MNDNNENFEKYLNDNKENFEKYMYLASVFGGAASGLGAGYFFEKRAKNKKREEREFDELQKNKVQQKKTN